MMIMITITITTHHQLAALFTIGDDELISLQHRDDLTRDGYVDGIEQQHKGEREKGGGRLYYNIIYIYIWRKRMCVLWCESISYIIYRRVERVSLLYSSSLSLQRRHGEKKHAFFFFLLEER